MKASNTIELKRKNNFNEISNEDYNSSFPKIQDSTIKEKEVFKKYGSYYTNFFEDSETSTPMFVDTNDFRTTKTVYMSVDLVVKANQIHGILFDPFSTYSPLTRYVFGSDITHERLADFREKLKSFSSYKIVASMIKIKQVSILSANDGFGTVMEAIITPSSFDPETQGLSPLNVNIESKYKMDTVDGRTGIKACLLGSPYIPFTLVSNPQPMINIVKLWPGKYDIELPIGTLLESPSSQQIKLVDLNGDEFSPADYELVAKYVQKTAVSIQTEVGVQLSKPNQGMKCWIKITPSNQDVTFKITYKVAMEVIPGPSLIENVQTFIPPFFYSTQRIFTAINNNYNVLQTLDTHIAHAAPKKFLAFLSKKRKEKEIEEEKTNKSLKENLKNDEKLIQKFEELELQEVFDGKAHASSRNFLNKTMKARTIISDRTENQPDVEIPEYIKKAVEFCNENISKIDSKMQYQRLMRNSEETLPEVNWQYFPVIVNMKTYDAVIAIRKGAYTDTNFKVEYKDRQGQKVSSLVYIEKEDFNSSDENAQYINDIMLLLNTQYFSTFHEEFTLRIFSPAKIEGLSYGAALILALMNSFPGQYSTGSVIIKDNNYHLETLNIDEIKEKMGNATSAAPLLAPCEDDNVETYIISGLMANVGGTQLFTYSTISELIYFSYIVPRTRGITRTPIFNLSTSISSFISNYKVPVYRKFLYLMMFANEGDVNIYLSNPKEKFKMPLYAFEKCNPQYFNNIVTYGTKKQSYVDIDDVLNKQPSLFNGHKVKKFKYNGVNYYHIPTLTSLIDKNFRRPMTEEIKKRRDSNIAELKNINENEIYDIIKNNYLNFQNEYNINSSNSNYKKILTRNRIVNSNNIIPNDLLQDFEKFKSNMETLKETLSELPNGNVNFFSEPQIIEFLEVPSTTKSANAKKLKRDPLIKYFEEIVNITGPADMKRFLAEFKISNYQRPHGNMNLNKILETIKKFNNKYDAKINKIYGESEAEEEEESSDSNEIDTRYDKLKMKKLKKIDIKNLKKTKSKKKNESDVEEEDKIESEELDFDDDEQIINKIKSNIKN